MSGLLRRFQGQEWIAQLVRLLQFLLHPLQLTRERRDEFDQPIATDPSLANTVLQLFNVHARVIINFPISRSATFTE